MVLEISLRCLLTYSNLSMVIATYLPSVGCGWWDISRRNATYAPFEFCDLTIGGDMVAVGCGSKKPDASGEKQLSEDVFMIDLTSEDTHAGAASSPPRPVMFVEPQQSLAVGETVVVQACRPEPEHPRRHPPSPYQRNPSQQQQLQTVHGSTLAPND
eukprot:UN04319